MRSVGDPNFRSEIVAKVRAGEIRQSDAARALGLSKQRLSQIINSVKPRPRPSRLQRDPMLLERARGKILKITSPMQAYDIARMVGSSPKLIYPLIAAMVREGVLKRVPPKHYIVVQR